MRLLLPCPWRNVLGHQGKTPGIGISNLLLGAGDIRAVRCPLFRFVFTLVLLVPYYLAIAALESNIGRFSLVLCLVLNSLPDSFLSLLFVLLPDRLHKPLLILLFSLLCSGLFGQFYYMLSRLALLLLSLLSPELFAN